MLSKKYRLKKNSAFTATYNVRNTHHKCGVTLFVGILKKNNDYPTKAGFVVSKKTHKRAVKRNRIKRLMRESYRLLLKENEIGQSQKYMSLIFIGNAKSLDLNFTEMKKIIKHLLEELK